jgi:hypothetical protein
MSRLCDGRREARRERLKRWVAAPLAAAGLAASGIVLTASPLFRVDRIQVTGNRHVPSPVLIHEAGVGATTNVFWFKASSAQARVSSDPWVASAAVSRELPGTIRIHVVERHPTSQVRVGSTWLLVASDGRVLGPAGTRRALPVLPGVDSIRVGARSPGLTVPARLAGELDPVLRSRVRAVRSLRGGHMALDLVGGAHVLLGSPTDMRPKARALSGIIEWAARTHVRLRSVDLRAPLAPAARLVGGP